MNEKAFEIDHDVFTKLSRPQLERMADAGAQIIECYRVLQKGGLNIVGEVLKGQGEFYELEHYPKDDVCNASQRPDSLLSSLSPENTFIF